MRSIIAALLVCGFLISPIWSTEPTASLSRDEVLILLRDGNARFVSENPQKWPEVAVTREHLATEGQHPFACIVTCSDSRVPPEVLFDRSLGDLFVIRLAGNVMTPEAAASVEYAVEHLRVTVVVVLGHTGCGAVKAALTGRHEEIKGPMSTLLSRIYPAVDAARMKGFGGEELYQATINENARMSAEQLLRDSRVIDEAVSRGYLTVLSAVYDLHSGTIRWQHQLMAAVTPVTPPPVMPQAEAVPAPTKNADAAVKTDTQAAKTKPKTKAAQADTDYAKRHR
ncbi:carbonic anhydrase [candidate division KSB1 bacterium]|nr:MAG: carbonic anhydrase [candidate division KSB1 bacterium]